MAAIFVGSFLFLVLCSAYIGSYLLVIPLIIVHVVLFRTEYNDIANEIIRFFILRSGKFQQVFWHWAYNKLASINTSNSWTCMNYGYHEPPNTFITERSDEVFCLQLYHIVGSAFRTINSFDGLNIIEVGSGRGGGLAYLTRTFNPESAIGVDLSEEQVKLCNSFYSDRRLRFVQGDSENLPIDKESADIVINVESSHCYGHIEVFYQEVYRVLRTGGKFLYTDFMREQDVGYKEGLLLKTGFKFIKKADITSNVLGSMDMQEERKVRMIAQYDKCKKLLLSRFAGVKGSRIYQDFTNRSMPYMAYELVKA